MGEADEDRVDLVLELREVDVDSIPLNFLDPRPGTPLADVTPLSPVECVKTLAMARLVHPRADLRIAGGREVVLRSLTSLALHVANSMFTDGYLTTPGAAPSADLQLIRDAGFEPDVILEGPDAG
jgi:biotin synthase